MNAKCVIMYGFLTNAMVTEDRQATDGAKDESRLKIWREGRRYDAVWGGISSAASSWLFRERSRRICVAPYLLV